MIMIDEAIYKLYPNAVQCSGGQKAYDKDGNELSIDWVAVNAELARLQAEYDARQYQRQRATAYPSIQEQLDMQYWDSVNGTTTWADAIAAVKQEFPKP